MNKIEVKVCVGTSCHLMGSQLIVDILKDLPEKIAIQVDLKYISCMNRCEEGPVIKIDDLVLENATPEQVMKTLKRKVSL